MRRRQVTGGQPTRPPAAGLQFMDQHGGWRVYLFREARLFHNPGKVRGLDPPVENRTGDSETRNLGTHARIVEKFSHNLAEFAMFLAGEDSLRNQTEGSILGMKIRQPSTGSPNIAGQDHFSKFLQRRPSRSRSSSASFGPHVPAGQFGKFR